MKFIYLLFTFFLTFISSFSQTYFVPDTLWTKSYGTIENSITSGRYVEQTSDGGYIVTGMIGSINSSVPKWYTDLWLLKMNQYGDTLWTKTYDCDDYDFGQMVLQTDDGGFIVLGSSGYENLWIIKTDCFGDSIWSRHYQGVGLYILQTNDGGYIITGQTGLIGDSDVFLLKIGKSGDSIWMKTYDIEDSDIGWSVQQTGDGGYIVSTTTGENDDEKLWLIKTNAFGDSVWMKNYGKKNSGQSTWNDMSNIVRLTNDGGFILVSTKGVPGTGIDVWIIKTDENGDTLWTRTYGNPSSQEGIDVRQLPDGGYILLSFLGYIWNVNEENLWLIRTNESGDTLWTRKFPHEVDYPYCVNLTSDNGFIMVGDIMTKSELWPDLGLIKINDSGHTLWTKSYGISNNEGRSIQVNSDGGFVVVGSTGSFGNGLIDVWLLKMDQFGDTLWTRTYGSQGEDYGTCFQQTSDGGYIIGGFTQADKSYMEGDALLIKTNSMGETIWTQSYDGNGFDFCYSVAQTPDGGYMLAGGKNVVGGAGDAWIIRTDNVGDTLWTRTFGGLYNDRATCIKQTSDGSFIITGWMAAYLWLIRIDDSGNSIFEKIYNVQGKGNSVLQTSDGGFSIVGPMSENGTPIDMVKTDEFGNIQWTQSFWTSSIGRDNHEIKMTSEGGYVIIVNTDHDLTRIVKTDHQGNMQWSGEYGYETGWSVTQSPDGGYLALGRNKMYPSQLYLMKLEPDSIFMSVNIDESIPGRFHLSQNYPNPFNPTTTIEFDLPKSSEVTLKVYNTLGEEITTLLSDRLSAGSYSYEWDARNLASGVYLYRLQAGNHIETRKMILMK